LLLLEEIDKARPHVLLLGYIFWHFLDLLAVANGRSRVVVLLLENVVGIRGSGLLETHEWEISVVVHAGLGDGHVVGGGRHFYFWIQ